MDKNLITRAITGAVYVILAVAFTLYGEVSLAVFSGVVAVFSLQEYYALAYKSEKGKYFFFIVGLLLFAGWMADSWLFTDSDLDVTGIMSVLALLLVFGYYVLRPEIGIQHLGIAVLGWLYVLLPMYLFYQSAFVSGDYQGSLLLMVFVLLWSTDTFAYLIGRKWGKHKLAPSISPGKSIEGLAGGIIGSLGVSCIFYYMQGDYDLLFYLGAALLVSIAGVFGDLMESKIKRAVGVKDSGKLLPGHGGFLDRFDSMLLAAPAFYIYVMLYLSAG